MENEERPHDYQAEEAILCAILHDNTALDKLTLEPADFYDPQHKAIYQGMLALRNKGQGIDEVTLFDSVPHQGDIPMMGSRLAELRDAAFSAVFVKDYAEIVRGKRVKRQMLDALPGLQAKFLNGAGPSQLREAWAKAGELLNIPETAAADPSFSVADVINAEIEAEPWVLDGILGVGQLSILTAQPGRGKTTVAWHLVRAAVKGGTFLERDIQRGGVAYLCLEEGLDSVQGAYERMAIQETDQIRVLFGDAVRADPIGYLTRHIEMHRPSLIIVDTMVQLLQIENLSDYSQTSPMMGQLLDLCRKQRPDGTPRPHIMLLHHAGKSEGAVFLGSTAIQAAVDVHLHLERQGGGSDARILTAEKQRAGQDTFPRTILTMSDEGNLEVDTAPVSAVKRGMEEQITEYLTDHPEPQTRAAILSNLTGDTTLRKKTLTAMKRGSLVVVDEVQKPPLYSLNSEQQSTWTAGLIEKSPGKSSSPAPTNLSWTAGLFPKESPASPAVGVRKHGENVNEQKSPDKQKSPDNQTVEARADALLTNEVETDATIEAGWWQTMGPDSTEPPPDGSAAYHAQRLSDLLGERLKGQFATPEALANRTEPYNDKINAVGCLRQWTALRACGVVIAAEPTVVGYTQIEEAPL